MYGIEEIANIIKMPTEAKIELFKCLEQEKDDKRFIDIKEKFYCGQDVKDDLTALAANTGQRPLLLNLAFCFFCTDVMYRLFSDAGYSDRVYLDSLIDLRIWTLTCKKNYGEWGLKEFDWLSRALRCKLFRLGRLQFEKVPFEYDIYEKQGVVIKKGDTVINTHIPEDGPMPVKERLESYKKAYDMFGFGNFVCESYLLYPAQYDFLSPESNIISFMNDFDIIKSGEDDKMNDMWRIFGMRESYEPSQLPRETSLQRAYADHIAKTGKNGWGYGVMIFDGNKIIK